VLKHLFKPEAIREDSWGEGARDPFGDKTIMLVLKHLLGLEEAVGEGAGDSRILLVLKHLLKPVDPREDG